MGASTFRLARGVTFEPFADGSALLYSDRRPKSVSLNHTAALLCSYADGRHPVPRVVREMQRLFPESVVEEDAVLHCLEQLVTAGFLQWE